MNEVWLGFQKKKKKISWVLHECINFQLKIKAPEFSWEEKKRAHSIQLYIALLLDKFIFHVTLQSIKNNNNNNNNIHETDNEKP